MAIALSDDIKIKAKRRWRDNERHCFYFKRNICVPLSPEVEDRLGLNDSTYVTEEILGNTVILTFYRKEAQI